MRTDRFDVFVIGGGGTGSEIVGRLASAGEMRVGMAERDRLGGECNWYGCVPSKIMLRSAKIAALARSAATFGVRTAGVSPGGARKRGWHLERGRRGRRRDRADLRKRDRRARRLAMDLLGEPSRRYRRADLRPCDPARVVRPRGPQARRPRCDRARSRHGVARSRREVENVGPTRSPILDRPLEIEAAGVEVR